MNSRELRSDYFPVGESTALVIAGSGLDSRSSLKFFFGLNFHNCLSCVHYCDGHSHRIIRFC